MERTGRAWILGVFLALGCSADVQRASPTADTDVVEVSAQATWPGAARRLDDARMGARPDYARLFRDDRVQR